MAAGGKLSPDTVAANGSDRRLPPDFLAANGSQQRQPVKHAPPGWLPLAAGAVAGWVLHPLESAALPRRTPTTDSTSRNRWSLAATSMTME
jgi:hypothetical protein